MKQLIYFYCAYHQIVMLFYWIFERFRSKKVQKPIKKRNDLVVGTVYEKLYIFKHFFLNILLKFTEKYTNPVGY